MHAISFASEKPWWNTSSFFLSLSTTLTCQTVSVRYVERFSLFGLLWEIAPWLLEQWLIFENVDTNTYVFWNGKWSVYVIIVSYSISFVFDRAMANALAFVIDTCILLKCISLESRDTQMAIDCAFQTVMSPILDFPYRNVIGRNGNMNVIVWWRMATGMWMSGEEWQQECECLVNTSSGT